METRRRILVEAGRIVSRDGYGALSMRKLARAVGLTAGALYRYFPSKQHVLLTYFIEALDQLTATLKHILAEEADLGQMLERMLIAYGEFALGDADRFRIIFIDREVTKLKFEDERGLESYELLRVAVEQARVSGFFRSLPTDDIARILLGSVHGLCVLALTIREIDFNDVRALIREAARASIRGLSSVEET